MWEINLLNKVDYYKRVLTDGCVIQIRDVEMCDLRFFRKRFKDTERPQIQVYKKNRNSQEFNQIFFNYDEALECFEKLTRKKND